MNDDAPNHDIKGAWGEEGGGDGGDLELSDRLSVGGTLQLLSPSPSFPPSPLLPSHSIEPVALRYCM